MLGVFQPAYVHVYNLLQCTRKLRLVRRATAITALCDLLRNSRS